MEDVQTIFYHSPIGTLQIQGDAEAIYSVLFDPAEKEVESAGAAGEVLRCREQLDAYFHGSLRSFDLNLQPQGTFFQAGVWEKLHRIPFGETTTYLELSKWTGDVRNVRAVGSANGKNPIAIIIPCHRVIGSDNKLVGYAGGIWRKKWLLEHEARFGHGVQTLF
ncbi:MAG: methylated-DNA--[protein]-cysteine S-methyltransferase [Chitinophagales bacterium]